MTTVRFSSRREDVSAVCCLTLVLLLCGAAHAAAAIETQLTAVPLRGLKAEVATLIVGGGDGGALALAVLAVPELAEPAEDPDRRSVPVLFELEGARLMEGVEPETETLTVELYLYALDDTGAVRGFFGRSVTVPVAELGEALYETGLKLLADVELVPGRYRLRFLAREPLTGRYALRTVPILVSGSEAEEPRLSAPLIAEPTGSWLIARPSMSTRPEAADEVSFPLLERAGEERLPTGLAPLPLGARVAVDLIVAEAPGEITVRAVLVPHEQGARPQELEASLRSRSPLGDDGWERLTVDLQIPETRVAAHRLEVSLSGAESEETVAESGLEAVTVPPSETELAWGQVRHYLASDVLERRAEVTLPRGGRRERREIDPDVRVAYRSVLERLVATSQTDRAVTELVEREREIFDDDPSRALDRLRDTEVTVARLLAEEAGEGLLPLVVLHLEAYRRHRSGRDFALATHARHTAVDITELYVNAGGGDEAAALAAAALTCLAGDLNQSRLWKQSDLLLERATDLDANSGLTLLLLASNRERFGEYAGATELLEQAVRIDPRADEARLRLGVNLRRLGRLAEAERTLRPLVGVGAEAWLHVLAYQELGRLLMLQGRLQEAERELRVALSRHPEEQGLHVLLGFVLERLGAPGEATRLLERVPAVAPDEQSPRYRYAQPRAETLGSLRTSVMRNAEVRLPRLARALSASAGG